MLYIVRPPRGQSRRFVALIVLTDGRLPGGGTRRALALNVDDDDDGRGVGGSKRDSQAREP